MNRRRFVAGGAAAVAAAVAVSRKSLAHTVGDATQAAGPNLDLNRHRFGVNYTPSHNWWFCWNDWNPDPIQRDLDAIAALGADHMRIMLVWPFFQPNPKWVSPAHLDRLDQLITLMGERHLDALVTVFTGQLSGWFFLPPFNRLSDGFYTDPLMWDAQELFVRELGRTMKPHGNVIGFDFGNELTRAGRRPIPAGDAWMKRMFALMYEVLPERLNVNGLDHQPVVQERYVLAGSAGGGAVSGDALLSLLERGGEVWRAVRSAEREDHGGDGSADSRLCRHAGEAGVGGRVQYLH